MNYKLKKFEKHSDARGDLVVFLKNSDINQKKKIFGQIYFITFSGQKIVRGNHYHKNWSEWFGIVSGSVEVALEDIHTKQRAKFVLDHSEHEYTRLFIGPGIAHAFISLTPYAALLNYADSEWYADDTYPYMLL